MIIIMKPERKRHIEACLQSYLSTTSEISMQAFDSLIGILSFCSQVILCLRGPIKFFFDKQTKGRRESAKYLTSQKRELATCKWILFYLNRWSGVTSIYRTLWLKTDLNIFSDAGTKTHSGEVWGIGAYCRETGEYISECWSPEILASYH